MADAGDIERLRDFVGSLPDIVARDEASDLLSRIVEDSERRAHLEKIRRTVRGGGENGIELGLYLLETLEASEDECEALVGDFVLATFSVGGGMEYEFRLWARTFDAVSCLPGLAEAVARGWAATTTPGAGMTLDPLLSISISTAEALVLHNGPLHLSGLTTLSEDCAEILATHQGALYLNGLSTLSDAAAASLGRHRGTVFLGGLASLSLVAVTSLRDADVSLGGLEDMTDELAHAIASHQGTIEFSPDLRSRLLERWLTLPLHEISASAARAVRSEESLDLSSLRAISPGVAEALSEHRGHLQLNGLTSICDRAAAALGRHSGRVELSGLLSLSAVAAQELRKCRDLLLPPTLVLPPTLASAVNLELAWDGSVRKSAATELTAEQTAFLVSKASKWGLVFSRLAVLSEESARELSRYEGAVSLNRLKKITDEALEALVPK